MGLFDPQGVLLPLYHIGFPGSQVGFRRVDLEWSPYHKSGSAPANELCTVVVTNQQLCPTSLLGAVLGGPLGFRGKVVRLPGNSSQCVCSSALCTPVSSPVDRVFMV